MDTNRASITWGCGATRHFSTLMGPPPGGSRAGRRRSSAGPPAFRTGPPLAKRHSHIWTSPV